MKISVALVCHNFQRRLCWMLSSIVQQTCSPFDIVVDVACLPGNGDPTTEKIANTFNHIGLPVKLTYIEDIETFAKRGLVRNIQVKNAIESGRDYVWFADADHIYHPDMFRALIAWLNNSREQHACVFSRAKVHTAVPDTDRLMAKAMHEMPYISSAFKRASELPIIEHKDKGQLAPGNMQIVSVSDIIALAGGVYVEPSRCRDNHLFAEGQKAWSDGAFRKRIGHSKAINLPIQIHLNHARDKEAGHHLEAQR